MPFLVIFIVIPLLELVVFANVGDEIGIFNTLVLAFLTAIIGGLLVRHQGFETLKSMMDKTERGKMPVGDIFDGMCILIAGATLITPGFLTDMVGFLLLIPAFRRGLKKRVMKHSKWDVHMTDAQGSARTHNPNVIEGEYETVKEEEPPQ